MTSAKRLPVKFFRTLGGRMPVREWLLSMNDADRKTIGDDIKEAEFGWPVGMPLCRSINGHSGLWEIRSDLSDGRIGRVFFCVHDGSMALLHGFVKKSQKTPDNELATALKRMRGLR